MGRMDVLNQLTMVRNSNLEGKQMCSTKSKKMYELNWMNFKIASVILEWISVDALDHCFVFETVIDERIPIRVVLQGMWISYDDKKALSTRDHHIETLK